ncbi:ABC transporter ATP-binding protein [Actinospica durhamensis]|uniref:ABC-type quaternary amine transporter n=1 Tax=Actinospica durhamensis TaxID=1508375 RepID=A0A941EKB4_9ACTN|nr:ABC transporter ATP-binding protein [Actinospica durhamensis]MBR7834050.1 ABC transporter ATP-binding protein [Actinospica durhamensis]
MNTTAPAPAPASDSAAARMRGVGLDLSGLHRSFGATRALAGFDLSLAPGELVALLGPSGCGKTTALRIVAGFDTPDQGTVSLDGKDLTRLSAAKRDMGMVFQSYSLFPHLTAAQNVGFGPRLRRIGSAERDRQADELLELVGMAGMGGRYPHQLSGGQQQRVALARALAVRPKVLLLDEPLSALDAKVRLQLREEIRRIQQEFGITTLFVTHDQEEALSMADRVAVMRAGSLEQCAAPAELYDRPATAFVAQFVGTMNHLSGQIIEAGRVRVAGRELPVDGPCPTVGTKVKVLIRPESLDLAAASAEAGTAESAGAGQVLMATFLGATTRLTVRLGDGSEAKADLPSHRASEFPVGSRVDLIPAPRPVLAVEDADDTAEG